MPEHTTRFFSDPHPTHQRWCMLMEKLGCGTLKPFERTEMVNALREEIERDGPKTREALRRDDAAARRAGAEPKWSINGLASCRVDTGDDGRRAGAGDGTVLGLGDATLRLRDGGHAGTPGVEVWDEGE